MFRIHADISTFYSRCWLLLRTICISFSLLCALFASPAFGAETVLIVGDDNYPPYCFLNNGKNDGMYVTILERIFSELPEYTLDLQLYPWRRGLDMVRSGEAAGIIPPYYGPNERPYIAPYSDPILKETTVVYCRDTAATSDANNFPAGYHGLTFGLNLGFAVVARPFQSAVDRGDILLEEVQGTRLNVMKLLLGRIDCYINDRLSILWTLEKLKTEPQYGPLVDRVAETTPVSKHYGYLGFSAAVDTTTLAAHFNDALQQLRDSGELARIVNEYLSRQGLPLPEHSLLPGPEDTKQ